MYYITVEGVNGKPFRKGEEPMARKKKNGNQNLTLQIIVLVTAILNLIRAVVDLIDNLTG